MCTDNIKTAVVGIGNMGSAHAECISIGKIKGMVLSEVCDINTERLHAFASSHPGIDTYESFGKMLEKGKADAVIIAVPHRLHADFAEKALESGMHVMVEKPADITVSKAARMNKTAERSGKVFGIMFNQRTNSLFVKAREIVKSGGIGALESTIWIVTNWFRTQSYYDSGGWRATWAGEGGGVLLNQAPHNLDIWQWVCGMPNSVTAFCYTGLYHNIEVEDSAKLITRYKNGAQGVFITSTGEYPGTNRLEISGSRGKLVLENGKLKHWKLSMETGEVCRTSKESFASIPYEYCEYNQDRPETGHMGILQNFADAILYGSSLISPGSDGIYELMLSNAAYMSQWKHNAEIKLPLETAEFDKMLSKKIMTSHYSCDESYYGKGGTYQERWRVRWE
ncbi:MAG: Gfo/Idh/MocA family oxidoreductase [Firmicutes bacterium]|nr:Gfo/Idh/MocA family oxidoreductase [Bacillota bacterium]